MVLRDRFARLKDLQRHWVAAMVTDAAKLTWVMNANVVPYLSTS
jgi:hypothetical protein